MLNETECARTGSLYIYGLYMCLWTARMHMSKILVWDGTVSYTKLSKPQVPSGYCLNSTRTQRLLNHF